MGIFDYKGRDASAEIAEAYQLASYANVAKFETLLDIFVPSAPDLPDDWVLIDPETLGVDPAMMNGAGFYTGENSSAAEAQIVGKYDDAGNLIKISITYAGTNGVLDIADYPAMLADDYVAEFDYLLAAVAEFAQGQGMTGEDVVVTGYSLGAGAVNNMATIKEDAYGGFFDNSDYFAFAVPKITEDPDVLNIGFENDVVHRIGSTGTDFWELALSGGFNEDVDYSNTTGNLVQFNGYYAQDFYDIGPWSILNVPEGWFAHVLGAFTNPITTMTRSNFAADMEIDSVIVVSQLTDFEASLYWVEDKTVSFTTRDHNERAFLLGTENDDKIRDGESDDFLDGFEGDDRFDLGTGNDTVHGGAGTDRVDMAGNVGDYEFVRLSDGRVFAIDTTGDNGVEELIELEELDFGWHEYRLDADELDATSWFTSDRSYSSATEGSTGGDVMAGGNGRDRLFGLEGDDTLSGGAGDDFLHGDSGKDTLTGGTGNDMLLGGAGDDLLIADQGTDILSGGLGADVFDLRLSDEAVITDLNPGGHDDGDVILLSSAQAASVNAALASAAQYGNDVRLSLNGIDVTLENTSLNDLSADDFLIV
ncbi:calcium-binding protein [Actibacterium lipolyticum]|uniref:Lipase n=1 Tax=Actibacterium lipolyticum TaxID=1524263 RepID=A0A238JM10_9RHOB|nr:calcium-binding protein [Actibacterium lipolyticum]SMX31709.1 Lipase precursor [Actibacterium lipolyticum]